MKADWVITAAGVLVLVFATCCAGLSLYVKAAKETKRAACGCVCADLAR